MKPQPKRNCDRQHEADSCYDLSKLSEALVDQCRDYIDVQEKGSSSTAFDFGDMSEALSICDAEDRESLTFRQSLIIKLGRQPFLNTHLLKVKKTPTKIVKMNAVKLQPMYRVTLRSLRKCT